MSDDTNEQPPKGDEATARPPTLELVSSQPDESVARIKRERAASEKPRKQHVLAALPVKRELAQYDLDNLHSSGLTDETIKLADLYTATNRADIASMLGRSTWPMSLGNVLVIPFYLPGSAAPMGYRVRPANPRTNGKKRDGTLRRVKYDQASEAGTLVYYPPRAREGAWYSDITRACYWTEGEKKALLLDQLGLCCVGLTGVFNYADSEHKDETGERLHPRIQSHVAIAGRQHVIVFDYDYKVNDQVQLAAGRLCGVLLAAGAASVVLVHPPASNAKGIDDYFVMVGEEATRQLLGSGGPIEPISPLEPLLRLRSQKAIHDAPIGAELRMPRDYSIDGDGCIWKEGNDEKKAAVRVARAPILIHSYVDDLYTGATRVQIAFKRKDVWSKHVVDRIAIADRANLIAELSPISAPVTSNTAAGLVDWFEALEHINEKRFERAISIGRAGWHEIAGTKLFILGEPIFADGERASEPVVVDDRGDRRKTFAALRPRAGSTLTGHIEALRRAWDASPICAAAICGAFAAPLLEPLDAPNFALHLPGDSSRGKTSMIKIAASVYGDPANNQWVASWNTSYVGAELRAAALSGLPLCFDEVGASDPAIIEKMVYMLINGGGKARGQKDLHLRETPTWRTIVLSTGERGLAGEDAATGAQVRVLQFHVSRFGDLDAAGVDSVREAAIEHYGHAGREWVQALLDIEDWESIRRSYKAGVVSCRKLARGPLQQRQATYFALLAVTEMLLHRTLGLGDERGQTMAQLAGRGSASSAPDSLALRARWNVLDWWHSEPDAFVELTKDTAGEPSARKDRGVRAVNGYYREADEMLLLIPGRLRDRLKDAHMAMPEVLRGWQEMGWSHCQPSSHDGTVIAKINGRGVRVVMLDASDGDAARQQGAE